MKTISLAKLHAVAPFRKPGYVDAALAASSPVSETHISMSDEDFQRIKSEYAIRPPLPAPATSGGPGTELKKLLAKLGIHASPTCKCNSMARKMDAWGPDESLKHVEEIVDVMEETAKKRGLPFMRIAGRTLVKLACRSARQKSNSQ